MSPIQDIEKEWKAWSKKDYLKKIFWSGMMLLLAYFTFSYKLRVNSQFSEQIRIALMKNQPPGTPPGHLTLEADASLNKTISVPSEKVVIFVARLRNARGEIINPGLGFHRQYFSPMPSLVESKLDKVKSDLASLKSELLLVEQRTPRSPPAEEPERVRRLREDIRMRKVRMMELQEAKIKDPHNLPEGTESPAGQIYQSELVSFILSHTNSVLLKTDPYELEIVGQVSGILPSSLSTTPPRDPRNSTLALTLRSDILIIGYDGPDIHELYGKGPRTAEHLASSTPQRMRFIKMLQVGRVWGKHISEGSSASIIAEQVTQFIGIIAGFSLTIAALLLERRGRNTHQISANDAHLYKTAVSLFVYSCGIGVCTSAVAAIISGFDGGSLRSVIGLGTVSLLSSIVISLFFFAIHLALLGGNVREESRSGWLLLRTTIFVGHFVVAYGLLMVASAVLPLTFRLLVPVPSIVWQLMHGAILLQYFKKLRSSEHVFQTVPTLYADRARALLSNQTQGQPVPIDPFRSHLVEYTKAIFDIAEGRQSFKGSVVEFLQGRFKNDPFWRYRLVGVSPGAGRIREERKSSFKETLRVSCSNLGRHDLLGLTMLLGVFFTAYHMLQDEPSGSLMFVLLCAGFLSVGLFILASTMIRMILRVFLHENLYARTLEGWYRKGPAPRTQPKFISHAEVFGLRLETLLLGSSIPILGILLITVSSFGYQGPYSPTIAVVFCWLILGLVLLYVVFLRLMLGEGLLLAGMSAMGVNQGRLFHRVVSAPTEQSEGFSLGAILWNLDEAESGDEYFILGTTEELNDLQTKNYHDIYRREQGVALAGGGQTPAQKLNFRVVQHGQRGIPNSLVGTESEISDADYIGKLRSFLSAPDLWNLLGVVLMDKQNLDGQSSITESQLKSPSQSTDPSRVFIFRTCRFFDFQAVFFGFNTPSKSSQGAGPSAGHFGIVQGLRIVLFDEDSGTAYGSRVYSAHESTEV